MKVRDILLVTFAVAGLAGSEVVNKSVSVNWDFSNSPVPRFGHGRLVAFGADGHTVTMFGHDGSISFSKRLELPQARVVRIRDVAAAPDGRVAAVASAQDQDGRSASIIAWLKEDGTTERVVRTTPFAPFKISFSTDGTLWAIGRVRDESFETVTGHDMIRRYDSSGKHIQSLLNSREFESAGAPHPARECFLNPSGDGMSAILVTAREWIDFGRNGEIVRRVRMTLPSELMLTGVGRSGNGAPLVRGVVNKPNSQARVASFRFVQSADNWEDYSLEGSLQHALLLGGGGRQGNVYWNKDKRSLIWASAD